MGDVRCAALRWPAGDRVQGGGAGPGTILQARLPGGSHRAQPDADIVNRLLAALQAGDEQASVTLKSEFATGYFKSAFTVSVPLIRERISNMVQIAASVPKDDRIWIVTSGELYNILQVWSDLTDLKQEIRYVPSLGISSDIHAVFHSSYEQTYGKVGPLREVNWTAVHNQFLEHLHFSYKSDSEFHEDIDKLRTQLENALSIQIGSRYRFIGWGMVPFVYEFALRTGSPAHIANTYFLGDNNVPAFPMNPDYFLDGSKVYRQLHTEAQSEDSTRMLITPFEQRHDDEHDLGVDIERLRYELYLLFMYNDTLHFIGEHTAIRAQFNPPMSPIDQKQFTMLGDDFTRPDDETAITKMALEAFLQTVENMTYEQWQKQREIILPRYIYFLRKGQLTRNKFWNHIEQMLRTEWRRISDKNWEIARARNSYHWDRPDPDLDKDEEYKKIKEIFKTVIDAAGEQFVTDGFLTELYSEGHRLNKARGKYYPVKDVDNVDESSSTHEGSILMMRPKLNLMLQMMGRQRNQPRR